jgi:pSer/pThr/pTyr-binding forkhead associated (FHA) protein
MAEDTVILLPVNNVNHSDVVLREARVTVLGRGKSTGISSPEVSRHHCELFWTKVPVVHVTPLKKRVVIEKCEQDVLVDVGETAQV